MNEQETAEQNAERHTASINRETARNQDMTDVFVNNEQGKRVLGYLIEKTGAFRSCGDNVSDSQLLFDAGQRDTVNWIFECIGIGASGVMDKYLNHKETVQ